MSGPPQARASFEPEVLDHLRASDEVMARLIDEHGALDLEARRSARPADAYGALLRSIVGQQLSTQAARAVYTRLIDIFGGRTPTPPELLASDPETIRAAGLSHAKVRYLRSLAEHVESGELDLDQLDGLSDERVVEELTAVKGLGTWTAHMFLMFHLGRPDVLPVGDLGVRRAVERLYGYEALPTMEEVEALGERWRPYRTAASLYLWRSLDNTPA